MISRRRFLAGSAAAATAWLAPPGAARAGSENDPVGESFRDALARQPWLEAFAPARSQPYGASARVEGRLPPELAGTLYRNGPAAHEVGGRRYHHWFDGDGLVQAFRIGAGEARHTARFVDTPKRQRELSAGAPRVPGFGTAWPDVPPPGSPAEVNAANISMLSHAGRLLALWEAGDAYRIDPASLETLGPQHWSPETTGVPFSAHPRVEPDGTLWNFGSAPWAGLLVLYRISPGGELQALHPVRLERPAYIHDFVVTPRHLVFLLPPLEFDAGADSSSFLEQHRWNPEAATRILVVAKDDPEQQRWLEMPACFVFHFGNAWEEPGGTIHLDAFRYDDASILYGDQRRIMWGRWEGDARASLMRLTLDPSQGRVKEERGEGSGEFPRVDPRVTGRRHRYLYSLAHLPGPDPGHPLFDGVSRRDGETGRVQSWRYPVGVIPEEHFFVPRSANAPEGEGWLLGTAIDFRSHASQLAVFDATAVDAGPLAVARLPYLLPLGLHGCFARA